MRTRIVWMAGLLALALGLTACGGGGGAKNSGNDNATPADNQSAQAETIYKNQCLSCHGADLKGGYAPELRTVGERMDEEELFTVIKEGRGGMPAFKGRLSDDEIQALVDWMNAQ